MAFKLFFQIFFFFFSHPTLYVFPGGQGDSALFGINGFNLLVDGGFSKKATFWDFSRHLDRLDAILITRISDDNAGGMSALLQRKTMSATYPQIGHVFANLPHSEKLSEAGQAEKGKYKKIYYVIFKLSSNLRVYC